VIVNRQEMINSIRLTSIFTSRANDVTLRVGDNKKFLEVFATESQLGENRYLVPAKLKGEKFSIVFNWRYLLDGLKIFDSDEIFLGINSADDNKPSLIKTLEDKSFIYILMPLKS
jgi:DNA polymerase-3 subunit beta